MSEFPVSNDGENTPLESNADKTFETELRTSLLTCGVSSRLLCGVTNQITFNKGALDWGYHGLLAFGSNCSVVTTDTNNIQPVQCLTKHRAIVNKVLWAPKIENCNLVTLVSSDTAGQIIHWNIGSGECIAVFQDGTKGILGMEWVPSADESCLLLATLHSPYHLVIWDVLKQTKLWKKGFTDTLISFSFNPFDGTRLAFLCPDCILFVDDFNPSKIPSTNGRKFYISSPRLTDGPEDVTRTRDRLKRLMKGLVVAETKPRPEDAMTVSECLQLVYHKSQRDHILLLYPRDILMVDLHINQTVGVISIEKAMSPLVQIISTRQRDVIYCLHESGSVSVKVRRKGTHAPYLASPMDAPTESLASLDAGPNSSETFMGYEHKCQSEVIRQIKGSRVLGMTCDLLSERNIALLLSSGKLVFLELGKIGESKEFTLNQLFGPSTDELTVLPPLRLLVTGLMSSVASQPTVIKMCPPLTSKNRHFYKPLMAAGTNSGLIQIYNMAWASVEKEFSLHSYPVRGIEWISLSSFISYAHSSTNSQVRNEMFITDVNTGYTNQIRKDRGEENPIDIVRVSPLKQYFVVVMKDGPFELWDLKTLTLMRSMPKKFPLVTALEWSPAHNFKLLKTKKKSVSEDPSKAENPAGDTGASSPQTTQQVVAREHFVFTDTESLLYHFTLEGIFVKDVIKMPPEAGMSQITSIAYKSSQIIQGDTDGSLNIRDVKARTSRLVSMNRGAIQKMKFAPNKGNLKLLILYANGVDIVDLKLADCKPIAQLKSPQDIAKIVDIDWASADTPVLATDDGCIRIMDLKLSLCSSSIDNYAFEEPVSCVAFMECELAQRMQLILSAPFWKTPVSLQVSCADGFKEDEVKLVNEQLSMMRTEVLSSCDGPLKVADRCLRAAWLMGDLASVDFWTVADYYIRAAALDTNKPKYEKSKNALFHTESTCAPDLKRTPRHPELPPLDTCYDVLCDAYSYQKQQLERVWMYEWKRGDYQHTKRVVERLILLGETDRAVQLLLETDLDNQNYYTDAIKACLISTIQSTGAAQSTIKLVATNLIANGKIWEGVQLLCLIGKGLDGCRYLMSYNQWQSAVWLAKSTLSPDETYEVVRKFSDHQYSIGRKNQAVLLMLSMGRFERVLETLLLVGQNANAGLLLLAYLQFAELKDSIDKTLVETVVSRFCNYAGSMGCTLARDAMKTLVTSAN